MSLQEGAVLNDRYRLGERIAAGGMGEVWQATDELLSRSVAVKLLKAEYTGDETFRTRFRAEAQNTAGLSHPGIAQVYDYGEQDDIAYLVMELVPGQPLSALLAQGERINPPVTLDIVRQAALALQAAHEVGLIHRDIKPGNLLVLPDGQVKITDFGIARAADAVSLTQSGTIMGTAHYVSPEQAEGRTLTPATDVYSLGVVAYECLAGRTPFVGDSPVALALAHVREPPPPLPDDVPVPMRELISRAMDKDPLRRPASGGELAELTNVTREALGLPPARGQALVAMHFAEAGIAAASGAADEGADGPATLDDIGGEPGKNRRKRVVAALGGVAVVALFAAALFWGFRSGLLPGSTDGRQAHGSVEPTASPSLVTPPAVKADRVVPAPTEEPSSEEPEPRQEPEPEPSEEPTPTPTPSKTETPEPEPTDTESPKPEPTESESPSPTPSEDDSTSSSPEASEGTQ